MPSGKGKPSKMKKRCRQSVVELSSDDECESGATRSSVIELSGNERTAVGARTPAPIVIDDSNSDPPADGFHVPSDRREPAGTASSPIVLDDAALIFRIDLTGERGTRALAGTAANPVCVSLLSDEDLARQMQRAFESEFRSAEAQSRRDLRLAKKLKRQDDEERQAAAESELFDILSDHRLSIQGWLATQQAIRPTHVVENPFSKPGMPLYNRFAEA
jgi:hypothetical protein